MVDTIFFANHVTRLENFQNDSYVKSAVEVLDVIELDQELARMK